MMARYLSLLKANLVSVVADGSSISFSNARRDYSASAAAQAEEVKLMIKREGGRDSNSWVPDPVTGYYRPANQASDMDAAELREMLLTQKFRRD